MSTSQHKKTTGKVKKLQDSFSDHHHDSHDQTQLQTPQHIQQTKPSNSKPKQSKIHKKEQDKSTASKNQHVKTLHQSKAFQQDEKPIVRPKKYEDVKSIKDLPSDDQLEEKKSQPKKITSKKNQRIKNKDQKLQQIQQKAEEIIKTLQKVYDQDVELYTQGKPADHKLKCVLAIEKALKEVELAKSFLNQDGHMVFIDWLLPNLKTRQETSLTVKIHVLNLLLDMRFDRESIERGEELERILKKYRKSRYEILRNLSGSIVEKWKITKALPEA